VRGCSIGLLLIGAVVIFLGAVAFALLSNQSGLPAQFTPVAVSTEAAARFDTKIATVQNATEPTTIEISEEEATSKLAALLATEPNAPQVADTQVAFRDGKIYLSGETTDTPIAIGFVITGRVEAVDGKPKVIVEEMKAGQFPVPGAMRSQVDGLVAEQERLMGDLPIYVTEVRVLDGTLVVTGEPK
jgi:hypothetical protein